MSVPDFMGPDLPVDQNVIGDIPSLDTSSPQPVALVRVSVKDLTSQLHSTDILRRDIVVSRKVKGEGNLHKINI